MRRPPLAFLLVGNTHLFYHSLRTRGNSTTLPPNGLINFVPLFQKLLKASIYAGFVKNFTSQDILSDKQYSFGFYKSTAKILTIIAERGYQVLHRNDCCFGIPVFFRS